MGRRIAVACALAAAVVRPCGVWGDVTLQQSTRMETQDDELVRVEKRAPGFGGMFVDSNGQLVLYLLDTAQLPGARAAVEAVFGADWVPAAGLRAVQGRYTVSQLARGPGGLLPSCGWRVWRSSIPSMSPSHHSRQDCYTRGVILLPTVRD
jgi:hypothetical protein